MLNILVCVKQVPDVNLVKIDPETGSLIRKGVPAILNPHDEYTLEAALRLKERCGGTVSCITMGPDQAEEALRECLAAGADRAVLLSDRAFANADTLATSYVIVSAANLLGKFDLIFCGKESLDGATGQMASQLAERFDAAQISCCLSIEDVADGKIRATRALENGRELVEATLPCLLTVEKDNYYGRLPSLDAYLASKAAALTVYGEHDIDGLDPQKIGVPGSGTIVPKIYPPELPEPGQIIKTGSARSDVGRLVELLTEKGAL